MYIPLPYFTKQTQDPGSIDWCERQRNGGHEPGILIGNPRRQAELCK